MTDYLKIGKATELSGIEYKLYRFFEMVPAISSIATLLILIILSYLRPIWVAYFLIAFDVYWLLQVIYMAMYMISSYCKVQKNSKINWTEKCQTLSRDNPKLPEDCLAKQGWRARDLYQLVILPTYNEDVEIIRTALSSILNDGFPADKMIIAVAMEERAGKEAKKERR